MSFKLRFLHAARVEYDEAVGWLYEHWPDTTERFIRAVDSALERIKKSPASGSVVEDNVRKMLVPGFRYYVIFYRVKPDIIQVLSVFHTSRDPKIWKDRI